MDRLPPDLRAALESLRAELDELGATVDVQNEQLSRAVRVLRCDSDRRATWWQAIAVIVAVVLVVLGGFAYTNRLAACGLIRALGTLNENVDGQHPTVSQTRIGNEADRLGDRTGCTPA